MRVMCFDNVWLQLNAVRGRIPPDVIAMIAK